MFWENAQLGHLHWLCQGANQGIAKEEMGVIYMYVYATSQTKKLAVHKIFIHIIPCLWEFYRDVRLARQKLACMLYLYVVLHIYAAAYIQLTVVGVNLIYPEES